VFTSNIQVQIPAGDPGKRKAAELMPVAKRFTAVMVDAKYNWWYM
jgi:hypothetical protein